MARLGVVPLKADFTRRSTVISEWLKRFGKAGVPMYLVVPSDPAQEIAVLPEVITPGLVVDALRNAKAAGNGNGTR